MEFSLKNNFPLTIVYLDGDDFKKINDRFSHDVGDVAIFALAQAIKDTTRDSDIQGRLQEEGPVPEEATDGNEEGHARMGGDEFVLVLPGADIKQAVEIVLPRFRARFAEIAAADVPEYKRVFGIPITVSAGIAEYDPRIDTDPNIFINRADAALSVAKQQVQTNGTGISIYNPDSNRMETKLVEKPL